MNILFVGHLYEKSGWGNAAKLYLKALLLTGHNVIARAIVVSDDKRDLSDECRGIQDCLNKPLPDKIDVCIQNILPTYMSYYGGCKNIGLFFVETYNLKSTPWMANIALMDEIWCPSMDTIPEFSHLPQRKVCIPCPIELVDTSKLTKLDIPHRHNYIFYFIGEFIKRKNVEALVKAFYREFDINEPVMLLLKTYKYGADDNDVRKAVDSMVKHIKKEMKIYKTIDEYSKTILINQDMSRTDILRLHKTCDCFVMPSYGEGACLPAMDALMVGNHVVGSDIGGLRNFISYQTRVRGRLEPVFEHNTVPGFGSSRELWFSIDPLDLQAKMRYVYENRDKPNAILRTPLESMSLATTARTIAKELS